MNLQYPDLAALLLRVGFGGFMLFGHGMGKLRMLFSDGAVKFPEVLGMPAEVALGLAVFAEVVACILIIVGYKTRLATLPMIITMLIAAFVIHSSDPFFMYGAENSKEPALIYFLGFMSIYLLGSGKYSVDDKMDSVL